MESNFCYVLNILRFFSSAREKKQCLHLDFLITVTRSADKSMITEEAENTQGVSKNACAKTLEQKQRAETKKNLHGILNIQASIHGAGLPETRQQSVPSRPHSPQQCPHSSMPCTCKTSLFSCSKLLSRHTLFLYWPVSGCAFGREGVFKQKTGNEEQVAAWLRIAPKQMWWLLAEMEGWIWLWLGQACG